MKIEITLDEKTWTQLCLLAQKWHKETPERCGAFLITQEVVNATWQLPDSVDNWIPVVGALSDEELDSLNAEVDRRIARA